MPFTTQPTLLSRYFQTKPAVIEVKDGETRDEAWRRYLKVHPGDAAARVRIFHYQAKDTRQSAKIY